MSGETYGLIIDTAGFVLTALVPWLARLVAGRRTMVHALLGGDGAGSPSGYACRILRRRVLSVGADDVKVHLSQPLREKVDYHDRGLNLVTSSESLQALLITARSQLQPKHDYYVPLAVGDGRTGLEPSDRQGGMTLVLKHEWTIRMRRVRWVAGVVTALLAVGALFAYLGWVVTSTPNSLVSLIGAVAALVAGVPGWRASMTLERAEGWLAHPPVSSSTRSRPGDC